MKDNKIQFFGGRGYRWRCCLSEEYAAVCQSILLFGLEYEYCIDGWWEGGFPEKECQKACPEQWLDVQHNDHPPPLQNYSLHVADTPTCHGSKICEDSAFSCWFYDTEGGIYTGSAIIRFPLDSFFSRYRFLSFTYGRIVLQYNRSFVVLDI